MHMQNFKTLKEATIYGANQKQVIKNEKYIEGNKNLSSTEVLRLNLILVKCQTCQVGMPSYFPWFQM